MQFHPGPIDGVLWRPLTKYHDGRGWLCELFRHDDLPEEFHPVMAYISATEPGVARGPHEHVDQADYFTFIGPSNFKMYLWDNRPKSKTYGNGEGGLDLCGGADTTAFTDAAAPAASPSPSFSATGRGTAARAAGRRKSADEGRPHENRMRSE